MRHSDGFGGEKGRCPGTWSATEWANARMRRSDGMEEVGKVLFVEIILEVAVVGAA